MLFFIFETIKNIKNDFLNGTISHGLNSLFLNPIEIKLINKSITILKSFFLEGSYDIFKRIGSLFVYFATYYKLK